MQAPQKEIFDICKPLLVTRSLLDVEAIVDKVFTEDAVFTHAFIIARGKKSIAKTYQFWKSVNSTIKYDIEKAGTFLAAHAASSCSPTLQSCDMSLAWVALMYWLRR